MGGKVHVRFGRSVKSFDVINSPVPHIVVPTVKDVVHGWFYGLNDGGRRECVQERILLNPYNGCSVECPACYSRGFGGYFDLWDEAGIVTVFRDFDVKCGEELDQLYGASCGYLSPTTDPFQRPLENLYRLSERTAYAFLDRGLPIEFITKQGDNIPMRLLDRMAEHPHGHCFCQLTILSLDDEVRRAFAPGGACVEEQFKAVRRAADRGLFAVVRMDPLLPGITDDEGAIKDLAARAKDEGARHLIFSLCDVAHPWRARAFKAVKESFPHALPTWAKVYAKDPAGDVGYRRRVFGSARRICNDIGITMALCMEFEEVVKDGRVLYVGLNDEYMTSRSCEGIEVPLYHRRSLGEPFKPLRGCNGNCLACAKGRQTPVCGEPLLAKASALKLRDYRSLRPSESRSMVDFL